MIRFFLPSILFALAVLGAVFFFGGTTALFAAVLLSILEVTLSFDNAVVNARVLSNMSALWQKRFLTWGIAIAVIGTRFFLPILIVSASVFLSPLVVAKLALFDSARYAELLSGARYAINSFGAVFLMMVSLKYFFNEKKDVHWIHVVERHLSKWGRIEALEIALALFVLVGISFLAPPLAQVAVLVSGAIGIGLFIAVEGIAGAFSTGVRTVAGGGIALFAYLNVLDAAFSLDSVVGAFALTNVIPVIVAGLGIGAIFVRSLTVYLVRKKTLDTLTYLEHGAHWAIFGLAASMFIGLLVHVPEIVTGTIGIVFVVAAYFSSLRLRRKPTR